MPILLVINPAEPIVSFALLLAVILIVPLCFERIKLPDCWDCWRRALCWGKTG